MNCQSMIRTATLLAALLCKLATLTTIAAEPQADVASWIVPLDGPVLVREARDVQTQWQLKQCSLAVGRWDDG
jgi:hypothetical protein